MDPAGKAVSSPRGPLREKGEMARKGRGRQWAAGSGEEGRGAVVGPLSLCELPSLLVPGRPDTRPHSAEVRPLQGEAPTRRGAGSRTEQ